MLINFLSADVDSKNILQFRNLTLDFKIPDFDRKIKEKKDYYRYYIANETEQELIKSAEREIKNQAKRRYQTDFWPVKMVW